MCAKAISWNGDYLSVLDQTKLPFREEYISLRETEDYYKAIKEMRVRGAPLIGIVAGYAIAHCAITNHDEEFSVFEEKLRRAMERIAQARPTAVNLKWAVDRMQKVLDDNILMGAPRITKLLVQEAKSIHQEELEAESRMAGIGASLIPPKSEIITICNTGELATGGVGTALGIIREAFKQNKISRVWVLETRPFIQGRLTAWELAQAKIPFRVVVDSAMGAVLSRFKVSAILVGADRIARNGDFANKVGTYQLAVLAKRHGVKFIVSAPKSTYDFNCPSGEDIEIEERSGDEVRKFSRSFVLPKTYPTWNPAFDVTPADLVSYYVSEDGVTRGKREDEET